MIPTTRHAPAKPTRAHHLAQVTAKLVMNPRRDDATMASIARSHGMTVEQVAALDAELKARRA